MKLQFRSLSACLLVPLLLSGCQAAQTPSQGGIREPEVPPAAAAVATAEPALSAEVSWKQYTDDFSSEDGSIRYYIELQDSGLPESSPVFDAVPHFLTEEEIRHAVYVLFPDGDFYAARPTLDMVLSKSEITDCITRWSRYTSEDAVKELYGDRYDASGLCRPVDTFINDYSAMLDAAPEESRLTAPQWHLTKSSDSAGNEIWLEVVDGNIPYRFCAAVRNQGGFKLSNLYAGLSAPVSPGNIDMRIIEAALCRTEKPGSQQLQAAQDKTAAILEELQLGQWQVDQCYVETRDYYGDIPEYVIHVTAVPCLNGYPAMRQPQFQYISSNQEPYGSDFYITDAHFRFTAGGTLLQANVESLIDIKNPAEANTAVMDFSALLDRARDYLMQKNVYHYAYDLQDAPGIPPEELVCRINVSNWTFGLFRVNTSAGNSGYRYIPGIRFCGSVICTNTSGDRVYYATDESTALVTMNALDGSVIY